MDDSFFDQIRIFNSNYAEDSIFLVIKKRNWMEKLTFFEIISYHSYRIHFFNLMINL